jgi:hypothetical protein
MYVNKGSTTGAFIIDKPLTIWSTELPAIRKAVHIVLNSLREGYTTTVSPTRLNPSTSGNCLQRLGYTKM